tara:strand:- start:645 stop:1040 length:396 start_codon:yes stop_codon:yes gene_type:complete
MPHRLIEYIPSLFFPFLGIVKAGEEMKFSVGTVIREFGVPILIGIITAYIATDRITQGNKLNLINHLKSDKHMSMQEKFATFMTNKEFEEFKERDKETQKLLRKTLVNITKIVNQHETFDNRLYILEERVK